MSAGGRIPLDEADEVAAEIVGLFKPYCERIEIAGSIRRRRPDVGDIEVVVIPRYGPAPTDLFGMPGGDPVDRLHEACEKLLRYGAPPQLSLRHSINGRTAWGRKLKWCFYDRGARESKYKGYYSLDIYSTTPEQWGVTLALRTGPEAFSKRLVTRRSRGGLCPEPLRFEGWRITRRDTSWPLETPEEDDVFEALGLDWIEPKDRK